jgi:hypothetical protein
VVVKPENHRASVVLKESDYRLVVPVLREAGYSFSRFVGVVIEELASKIGACELSASGSWLNSPEAAFELVEDFLMNCRGVKPESLIV